MTLQNVAPRLSNTDKLRRFRKRIERCMRHKDIRPFTCSGSPYCCRIFIVGLNSATWLKPFFETYWSDDSGFLRDIFEEDYQKIRKKRGVRPRIEAFVNGAKPIPCLETNLYAVPTKRSPQLKLADKDPAIFEILLEEIQPDAIFLFSNEPIEYFRKYSRGTDICGDNPVAIDIRGHKTYVMGLNGPLFTKKIDEVHYVGKIFKELCMRIAKQAG